MHFLRDKVYFRMKTYWRKASILFEKHGYQFPRLAQFDESSCYVMGNLWENLCIFNVINNTLEWELDGAKASILWYLLG